LEQAETMMANREIQKERSFTSSGWQTARAVAFGAMKFRILLQDSEKKILFDKEQALSFEGETWPYLQYTYARINSILKKSASPTLRHSDDWVEALAETKAEETLWTKISFETQNIDYSLLNTPEDKALFLQLAQFSEEIQKAAQSYKPNYIARFCLNLAQLFNSYYHHHKIIDEENPELSKARLVLIQAVQQVLANGLELLGIETVESM
jgi:arginyl-tRNA synthetase